MMEQRAVRWLTVAAGLLLAGGTARAQSAATCAFDPASARVTVTVNQSMAALVADEVTREIRLDGVPCGAATVDSTDTIQVNGSGAPDRVSLSGSFASGLTAEADGVSEIEIVFALGTVFQQDRVVVHLTDGPDDLRFGRTGIDVGSDLDVDMTTTDVWAVIVDAGAGDDRINAAAYDGHGLVAMHGRGGRDTLIGSGGGRSHLDGGAGDDYLAGGPYDDELVGGPGNDTMFGRAGWDRFDQGREADGADDMRGGDGNDIVFYSQRTEGVTVTIGDARPDGEPGEGDTVRGDIEVVHGGDGPDVLVGNDGGNTLTGGAGNDELYGGGGNDNLSGGGGDDLLVGDDGDDYIYGGGGDDTLDGGRGNDLVWGEWGNDTIDGGPGLDEYNGGGGGDTFFNRDAQAETVDCGAGIDDAEPDPLDTFIGCEL